MDGSGSTLSNFLSVASLLSKTSYLIEISQVDTSLVAVTMRVAASVVAWVFDTNLSNPSVSSNLYEMVLVTATIVG
jgi:hypothetical protein